VEGIRATDARADFSTGKFCLVSGTGFVISSDVSIRRRIVGPVHSLDSDGSEFGRSGPRPPILRAYRRSRPQSSGDSRPLQSSGVNLAEALAEWALKCFLPLADQSRGTGRTCPMIEPEGSWARRCASFRRSAAAVLPPPVAETAAVPAVFGRAE
jgi:hypothetical protein